MPFINSPTDRAQMKNLSFKTDVLPMKDKLFRLAMRITLNQQDAEDVVQETLIKIWNRREQWENIDAIEPWAMTIARNIAIDTIRKRDIRHTVSIDSQNDDPMREQQRQSLANSIADSLKTTPYEKMQEKERLLMVRKLMDALPEKQKTAMYLRDFEEKTYKEIAGIMQITEDQVKINIFRARQYIKGKYNIITQYGL